MQSTTPTDRSRIVDFLEQVDRRLRLNDGLVYLSRGLWGLIALLVLLKLSGFWERPGARLTLLAIYGVGLVGYVGYRFISSRGLSRAAVIADRRAVLHDTLTSAHAFLGLDERTKWMNYQIGRAAELTEKLTTDQIAPTNLPGYFRPALGVGIALFALLYWNPTWLPEIDSSLLLSRVRDDAPTTMKDHLDEAETLPEEQGELTELEEAIESLKSQDLELAAILGDLELAQEVLAASQVDMQRLEMDFDQIAANLDASATLSELSEALKARDTEGAAEHLRELANRLSETQSHEELQALLRALSKAQPEQTDLFEILEGFDGETSDQGLAEMAQALRNAADQLGQLGQQVASQQSVEPGQEIATLESSLAQHQENNQATQNAVGMKSDEMQMAQMQVDSSSALPLDVGLAGDNIGSGGSGSEEQGEATSLEVQLEMELLEKAVRNESVPEEIFERLSREEKSKLNYQTVQQMGSYAKEKVLTREHVPWQYRSLVKRYFMSIIAKSNSKAEPSQEK